MLRKKIVLMAILLGGFILIIFLDIRGLINLPFVERISEWSIGIYTAEGEPMDFRSAAGVQNPVLTYRDVRDAAADFIADPFMIRTSGGWYMFFEVMNRRTSQGDIGVAESQDGIHWKYRRIILDEPFHLSYPYVFTHDANIYMLIGTHVNREIRLYRANVFPDNWIYDGTLINGEYSDCSLLYFRGKWWLFAAEEGKTLLLFFSNNLRGEWKQHPMSPILRNDLHYARPGGRILFTGKNIYRFAQDDATSYGRCIWAFQIMELTEEHYREERILTPVLSLTGDGWNSRGMHNIDLIEVEDGRWIACTDGVRPGRLVFFR